MKSRRSTDFMSNKDIIFLIKNDKKKIIIARPDLSSRLVLLDFICGMVLERK